MPVVGLKPLKLRTKRLIKGITKKKKRKARGKAKRNIRVQFISQKFFISAVILIFQKDATFNFPPHENLPFLLEIA